MLECYRQSLTGDSGESSKDLNTDRNVDQKEQAQEVSLRNNDFFGNWTTVFMCLRICPLPKMSTLCPGFHNLQETTIKGYGLIDPVKKISRQLLLLLFSFG